MRVFFVVLSCLLAFSEAHSPVVLWPAKEFELNEGLSPMETITAEKFEKMITKKNIIVFTKHRFSLEDISLSPILPPYLNGQDLMALQSVQNLHRFLKGLKEANKIEVVPLKDDDILKNDQVIKETMEQYKGYAALLVSTGSHPISKRAVGADPAPPPLCEHRPTADKNCSLVYIGSGTKTKGKLTVPITGGCTVECNHTANSMTLTVGEHNELVINVTPEKGGYVISVEEYTFDTEINWFPNTFSYSCGKFNIIPRAKTSGEPFQLKMVQIQMLQKADVKDFDNNTWDCQTWLTTPLVMGLVVVLFYISLLFGAVLFLLDIKTNDRFDDPKGKTITVNVSE